MKKKLWSFLVSRHGWWTPPKQIHSRTGSTATRLLAPQSTPFAPTLLSSPTSSAIHEQHHSRTRVLESKWSACNSQPALGRVFRSSTLQEPQPPFLCITRDRTDFSGLNSQRPATQQTAAACVYSERQKLDYFLDPSGFALCINLIFLLNVNWLIA